MLVEGKMPADAVFAANDLMAVGCLMLLGEAGLKVPHDLMVAGFDDITLARHITPALTTIHVKLDRLGSPGMLLLLRLLSFASPGTAHRTRLGSWESS